MSNEIQTLSARPLSSSDISNEILSEERGSVDRSRMRNCPIEFIPRQTSNMPITRSPSEESAPAPPAAAPEPPISRNVFQCPIKRETIDDYCFDNNNMDPSNCHAFDSSLVDLSARCVIPKTMNKEYIYDECVNLLNENRYLRDQLKSMCHYICPSAADHMYCDTATIERVTNMLDRWGEFDILPRDISRVTLTRGSNAVDLGEDNQLVDDCWEDIDSFDSYSTHSSMPSLIDGDDYTDNRDDACEPKSDAHHHLERYWLG